LEVSTLLSVVNNYNVGVPLPLLSRRGGTALTLYDKCREMINIVNNDFPTTGQLVEGVYINDKTTNSNISQVRCYNVDTLLSDMVNNDGAVYSSQCKRQLSPTLSNTLRQRYQLEIAMVKYSINVGSIN
jgi:hypothetical protein